MIKISNAAPTIPRLDNEVIPTSANLDTPDIKNHNNQSMPSTQSLIEWDDSQMNEKWWNTE